ncbi:MAG: DNA repair protein RadA [Bradymonadaceae bacterium]
MASPSTVYVCRECGHEFPKWQGRCPDCGEWNSFVEEVRGDDAEEASAPVADSPAGAGAEVDSEDVVRMAEIDPSETERLETGLDELDRVLGGGLVPGGVVLLGGDPGIGKSTLSLQVAGRLSDRELDVLYLSGEESLSQLKMRADRLAVPSADIDVVCETTLERVDALVRRQDPDLLIVDSIQTLHTESLNSSPGSVAQLKEVTSGLTQRAKGEQIPAVLIGHVTKEGAIAGPKVLEHMVDTVLYFEGRSEVEHRVLRAVKNRYGSTDEIGVFTMREQGLEEVVNPSALFLEERPAEASGSAVVPIVEGTRPLLVEIQALVGETAYGPPSVTSVGVDRNRVVLLLNIIEKRTGLDVAGHDVFVNVAGGMSVSEPAADLGLASAVLSSYVDRPVPEAFVTFGEVGLTGEVRAVSEADRRLEEAEALGFSAAALPQGNREALTADDRGGSGELAMAAGDLAWCRTLADVVRELFGADIL